jgi:AmmeMemoRadiSam system protein B
MRPPAVAGEFYEGSREGLIRQIEWCYTHRIGPGEVPSLQRGGRRIIGLVSPHAGYMYSGPVAAHGFAALAQDGKPDRIIILGPNHHGIGSGVSLMSAGRWITPLGEVEVDGGLAKEILENSEIIDDEEEAHRFEHSIEVQLPFLQHLLGEFKFVPVCMMLQDIKTSLEVGEALASACRGKDVLIVASTDFTHYEPQESAERKDRIAIEKIVALDPKGLVETVEERGISMCGYGPVAAMLEACKRLGARTAKLLKYATSGDTSGYRAEVVGYASLAVYK